MTKKTIKRIRLIYGIALSAVTVIAGICLMVACVGIYQSGDQPFSPQAVAESFSGIALPVYLCLVLIVGGFILDFVLPSEKKRLTAAKQHALILQRLHEKNDLSQCAQAAAIRSLQKSRKLHWTIGAILLVSGSIIFLIYALNENNFHQTEINTSMIKAMYVMLPCLVIPFAYAVFSAFYAKASIQKEIELVKQAVASGCPKAEQKQPQQEKHANSLLILRYALLCVGIGILVYGFFAGGTADVLTKAVNICTECVGLG